MSQDAIARVSLSKMEIALSHSYTLPTVADHQRRCQTNKFARIGLTYMFANKSFFFVPLYSSPSLVARSGPLLLPTRGNVCGSASAPPGKGRLLASPLPASCKIKLHERCSRVTLVKFVVHRRLYRYRDVYICSSKKN